MIWLYVEDQGTEKAARHAYYTFWYVIVIFDPDTVRPGPESIVHDFPGGGWRVKEPAQGIMATIVNGEVLLDNDEHTGALPGKVLRNTYYHAHNG